MTPERWQQITEIFHAARNRLPGDRTALLNEACRGDDVLREEVARLLSAHDAAGTFGDAPAPLEPGRRLGAYRIESLIGRGGMGEVYRARDTTLQRDVAIKVLPAPFLSDPARIDRLGREARALAALNHPNVATIYGIERADGVTGLVLEFVDGVTLADRIAQRRMPMNEVLAVAGQLVDALEAAHDRGLIHRDIKPSNIKITPNGIVKVLDFGLARTDPRAAWQPDGSQLAGAGMMTTAATREGVIVGTPAYMSPEQARGQAIDRRTDIWAFGCVLFEMLTSRQTFVGDTPSDTLAAVLERDPAWEQLPASTPEGVRRLLRRCLDKDSQRRLRDIGDARFDLNEGEKPPAHGHRPLTHARSARNAVLAAFIAVVITSTVLAWLWKRTPPSEPPPIRFSVTAEGVPFGIPAISPDGRSVAFQTLQNNVATVWIRSLGALEPRRVAGSEYATVIGWSPDGRSLAFLDGRSTKLADIAGGGAVRTVPGVVDQGWGVMWCPDGRIVAGSLQRGGLFAESIDGSAPPRQVTSFDLAHGEGGQIFPALLPDGGHFLYLSEPSSTIWIASLDSPERRQLTSADSQAVYVPPGYLLFVRRQTLFAQRFDANRLELAGTPVAVVEGVLTERTYGADFSASASGAIAYRSGTVHAKTQLKWVDRLGRELGTLGPPGRYANIELSADGSSVVMEAFDTQAYTKDIWKMDTARGVLARLTFDSANDTFPIWSPDGRWVVFASDRQGGWQLFRKRADGLGADERVATTAESMVPQSWTPDGRSIVYLQRPANLGVLQLDNPVSRGLIDKARFEGFGRLDGYGEVSPDGRWLLYGSNESGSWELYLRRFPEQDAGKWKVSATGAISPQWRSDGREIFYYSSDGDRIMAVPITTATTPVMGSATALFKARLLGSTNPAILWRRQYAASPDGQRFLLNERLEDNDAPSPVTVDTNWMAALKK